MAASVWSGYLTFGLISMPVRLYSGARSNHISFNMLHRDDNARIKQQLYCPVDERVVERDEIVKGYEYRKGEYVIIEPEDLKKIEPRTAKAMEILEFIKAEELDPIYYDTSYYLMPEEAGQRPYALLQKALDESGHVAVAKLTMHNREYTVFLRPYNGGMMLHTMYYQDEIRELEKFGDTKADLKEAEVKVAHQLIKALEAEWEPEKYRDTYQENVKQLIKARLEGREVVAVEQPGKPAPVVDLMAALKQSLADMEGRKKGPQRVEQVQRESEVKLAGKKSAAKKKKSGRKAA
jgi:DNA end-binding protein Ku